jgi:hypothetical protein
MIASRTEIKAILQVTTTTNDDLIDRFIPIVESDIREYCNNNFVDDEVYLQSSGISFTANTTSGDTINLDVATNGFVYAQFKDGQTVYVLGSYNNDGFFEVETVSSATLTLYTSTSRPYFDELVTEDKDVYVSIFKVLYPNALKFVVADMVNYKLTKQDHSVVSETVSRYSVTYNRDTLNGYPKSLMAGLNKWRHVRFV